MVVIPAFGLHSSIVCIGGEGEGMCMPWKHHGLQPLPARLVLMQCPQTWVELSNLDGKRLLARVYTF